MKKGDIISFLEVSTGAKVKSLHEEKGFYLFTLAEPEAELYPPRFSVLLFIDFDKREAAFAETEENLSRDIELQRKADR